MCIVESVSSSRNKTSLLFALALTASTAGAVVVHRKFKEHFRKDPELLREDHEDHDHGDEVSELSAPFLSEDYLTPIVGFGEDLPPLPENEVQKASLTAVDVLPGMFPLDDNKRTVAETSADETEQTFCSVWTTETLEI